MPHLTLSTGVRLRCIETGSPEGEPVLLLHGYTDSAFSFSPVLPFLPSSFRAIVPDHRGHGMSERPERGYAMTDFAADAVALLDCLGIERATVVGHSMGGFIAQQMAIEHPERVERLVLAGTAANPRNESVLELRAAVEALEDPVPPEFAREFQASTIHRRLPPAFFDAVVAESLRLPSQTWREVMSGMMAMRIEAELHRIRVPTLVLWGDRDAIFGRDLQHRLCAGIAGAELRVYPETGHALHWEQPECFAGDLESFVRARSLSRFGSPLPRSVG